MAGITPITTHPERHPVILRDRNLLYDFIAMGALSQITAMSLTGEFGDAVQGCSQELLKHRLVHVHVRAQGARKGFRVFFAVNPC